jgi:hypothetical protein
MTIQENNAIQEAFYILTHAGIMKGERGNHEDTPYTEDMKNRLDQIAAKLIAANISNNLITLFKELV